MNLQALMKQAQAMQKSMTNAKAEIDAKTFIGKSSLVEVKLNGKREVLSVNIDKTENIEKEDIEMLEDMIVLAMNDALNKIDVEINEKLGSQAGNLSGLL